MNMIKTRNIYIISDTHFSHSNFLNFLNEKNEKIRNFSSIEEMDELMIQNWNNTVKQNDIVYHLGDVFFNDGYKHLHRLNGRKRLIIGNHDNLNSQSQLFKYFEKIMMWRIFKEFNCVLTHVPIHESSLYKVEYNLHGHIHQQASPTTQHINCCVELNEYTPKNIEDIMKRKLKKL